MPIRPIQPGASELRTGTGDAYSTPDSRHHAKGIRLMHQARTVATLHVAATAAPAVRHQLPSGLTANGPGSFPAVPDGTATRRRSPRYPVERLGRDPDAYYMIGVEHRIPEPTPEARAKCVERPAGRGLQSKSRRNRNVGAGRADQEDATRRSGGAERRRQPLCASNGGLAQKLRFWYERQAS